MDKSAKFTIIIGSLIIGAFAVFSGFMFGVF
jgi:hypothetical protein